MKILLCLMFLLSACKSPSVEKLNPLEPYLDPAFSDVARDREEYMLLVNAFRHNQGLDSFLYSTEIEQVAQDHSEKMANGEVPFGHLGSSLRCQILITEIGPANLCGEIVASGQDTPAEVFNSWTNSSTHKSKILNSRYTHTGLGKAKSSKGVIYWTQIFLEVL